MAKKGKRKPRFNRRDMTELVNMPKRLRKRKTTKEKIKYILKTNY